MRSAWIVVIAMSGVASAGPDVENSKVTESLREIELAVSDGTTNDPRDYVLADGDRRLTAERVSQDNLAIAFIVAAGDPIIPTLLDGLALERFEGEVNRGMVIEYGETVRVLAEGRLDTLRVAPGSRAPQQPGDLLAAFDVALEHSHQWAHHAIVVVGNGVMQPDQRQLRLRKGYAGHAEISTYAIVRPSKHNAIQSLIPRTFTAPDDAALHRVLRATVDQLAGRKHVTFRDRDGVLDWDGRVHGLDLVSDRVDRSPDAVVLPYVRSGERDCDHPTWWWAALVGGLAILVAGWWTRRTQED